MKCIDCDDGREPCDMNCGPVRRTPMRRVGKYRLTKSVEDGLWRVRGPHGTKPIIIAKTPGSAVDKLHRKLARAKIRSAH